MKNKRWLKVAFRVIIILGLICPMVGAAEIYKYIDNKGVTHFTDRFESIPVEYRPQIKIIKEQPSSPISPPAAEPPKEKRENLGETTPPKTEPPLGRREIIPAAEEEKIKAREEKEKQISELRQQIEEKRKQQKSLRTSWMVYDRHAIVRLNQEIEALEKQIKVLQRELEEER